MLKLDGEKLVINGQTKDPLILLMNTVWNGFEQKFNLKNGGNFNLIFNKEKFPKELEVSDETGRVLMRKRMTPSKIILRYSTQFWDANGTQHDIMYYEKDKVAVKDEFRSSMTFTIKDKEKFIFLYLFSKYIKSPKYKEITLGVEKEDIMIVEDTIGEAANAVNSVKRESELLSTFFGMTESHQRVFAGIIGISGYKTMDVVMLEKIVSDRIKSDFGVGTQLKEFHASLSNEEVKEDIDVMDILDKAIRNNKVKSSVYAPGRKVTWKFVGENADSNENIVEFEGTKEDKEIFILWLKEKPEILERLK